MNENPVSRRQVFRPMSLAIQSLSVATASSVFLWTLSGGFDLPLPPLASAATKAEKPKKGFRDAEPLPETTAESVPTAIGNSPEAELPAVKLNHISAPWEKVIRELAKDSQSELIMDRVPKGRYTRRDSNKYNRHDAVRIINKDTEPLGFRLIEKGDFLIVLELPQLKPRYAPAVLPVKQEVSQAAATEKDESPFERRVDSITKAGDKPEASRKGPGSRGKGVRQVAHEEELEIEDSVPEPLQDEQVQQAARGVFRPRHRTVLDLSKQVYKSFKPRAELINAGRDLLPAFRISVGGPQPADDGDSAIESKTADKAVQKPEVTLTMTIDEVSEELLLDGPQREVDAAVKMLRTLDRPVEQSEPAQLVSTTRYVCQIAHQLPAELDRIRAAKKVVEAKGKQPLWLAQAEQNEGQNEMPQEPETTTGVVPGRGTAGEILSNLNAEVIVVPIPDLGAVAVIGNQADVEMVTKVIRDLEQLSEATAPQVHLLYLKHVDAESLAELLTAVNDRLTRFPGQATQPRQSAAIMPINKPNALLIIAPKVDMQAILDMAEELDQPVDPLTEFQVFRLKTAIASQVAEMITTFYAERINLPAKVFVVAEPRSNALIVRAQPRDLDEVAALIRKIDRDDPAAVHELKLIPLKNALASEIAIVMNAAIQSVIAPPTTGTGGGGGLQSQTGINPVQLPEEFRAAKMMAVQLLSSKGNGEKIRSGILADIRITPDARVNSLVVSASQQSMPLIEELIKQLDQPTTTVSEIKVFTLANADAELMVQQLNALFNNQQQGGGQGNQQRQNLGIALEGAADSSSSLVPLKFSVDKRTNSVIAVGARDALGVVEAILLRLDESDLRARQNVVIRLQNSQATLIAQSIAQFYQSQRDIAQQDPNLLSSVEQMEKEVVVVPDQTNNSLLLSATPRYFKNIENMILKLDAAPRQVIIQALLVEVELQNTDEFGVELGFQDPTLFKRSAVDNIQTFTTQTTQNQTSTTSQSTLLSLDGTPGFNFNNTGIPLGSNVSPDASNPAIVAAQGLSNFSLGRVNSELGFGGLVLSAGSDAVNVLIRALSAHRKITVLSRPQIRALDNQLAEIFSGQNIPVITGFSANGTTGVNTPLVTQRDAGVQLQVQPRITADGNVVMMLYAQRSQYRQQGVPLSTDATGRTITSPILDISRLQTTISVPTGNTVVIGGLINSRDESFTNKAPFLSEIPLLGHLFRFDSRTTRRVELLVFLTPRIINGPIDEETIKDVEMGRMHFIESEAEELQGPLRALPCPDELFDESKAPTPVIPNAPQVVPGNEGLDLPPPPPPAADPSTSVIRDGDVNPVGARLRYTEEDTGRSAVQQAKAESTRHSLFGKKQKQDAAKPRPLNETKR